jgi:cell wall-associated NlpC family hydrolase
MNRYHKLKNRVYAGLILLPLVFSFLTIASEKAFADVADSCQVVAASWNPSGQRDKSSFFRDGKVSVDIEVRTAYCEGEEVELFIWEEDRRLIAGAGDDTVNIKGVGNKFQVPNTNSFTIKLLAGEDECESVFSLGLPGYDCHYYFEIDTSDSKYSSYQLPGGDLWYECDVACDEDWKANSIVATTNSNPAPEHWYYLGPENPGGSGKNLYGSFPTKEECIAKGKEALAPIPPATTSIYLNPDPLCSKRVDSRFIVSDKVYNDGTTGTHFDSNPPLDINKQNKSNEYDPNYKLLAPIGNLTEINNSEKTLGDYLNIIFKIAIGLCIALSVIMLVIYGIQYMGDESVFGKTEAMSSIRATILGLIIALGAYAILNTINPALVGGSVNIKTAVIKLDPDSITPGISSSAGTDPSSGKSLTGTFAPSGSKSSGTVAEIANSYINKASYYMGGQGAEGVNGTVAFDCGGFVNRVRKAAGLTDYFTNGMFQSDAAAVAGGGKEIAPQSITDGTVTTKTNEKITLKAGDVLGWPTSASGVGHIVVYIGDNKIAECHGPGVYNNTTLRSQYVGKCVSITDLKSWNYTKSLKYVVTK